ncbi:ABC transporter substrate-binding protein [Streptomyces sp. 4N509B]|uniref:ABC transporter substrate-binding protein n=1 Tax=Streptomyces sp. 4N509B TaxID=3457413 RepID=UPI003FD41526
MRTKSRWRPGRQLVAGVALLTALALSGCGSSDDGGESADGLIPWKHGIHHPGAEAGFLMMADHLGLFEKYGLDLEIVDMSSGTQTFPALVAGEIDSLEGSPGALYPAAAQGQDIRVVGSSMPGLAYALYAKDDIASVEDLEGASIAISAPNALPAQVAQAILRSRGVDTDSIQWVNAGSNADRYRAVVSGAADAASSPSDFVPQSESEGVRVLAESIEVVPDFPRYTVMARGEALEDRPEGMVRFLAAMAEGIQYAIDHPDEAAEISAEYMGTTADDPMITYMTDLIIEEELVAPDVRIPVDEMNFLEGLLRDMGELDHDVDIDAMVDESFREQALDLVEEQASSASPSAENE